MTGVLGAQLASGLGLSARQVVARAITGATVPVQALAWMGDSAFFGSSPNYPEPSDYFMPTGINSIDFAIEKLPSGSLVSIGASGSMPSDNRGYLANFNWTFNTGFGTKLSSTIADMSQAIYSVKFSPDGTRLAVGHLNSPFITVYGRDKATNTLTAKRANPATLPPSAINSVEFSPSGDTIAVAHADAPRLTAYSWNGDFGTKFADPIQLYQASGMQLKFSPDGNYLAFVVFDNSPISVYPWSSSTGFGTRISSTALPVNATSRSLTFSPSGNAIIQGFSLTPFMYAYPWSSGGFGTRFANPSTSAPTSTVQSVIFSGSGSQVIIGTASSPGIRIYLWNNGFAQSYGTDSSSPIKALAFATEKV